MTPSIELHWTLSRPVLGASSEPQLLYLLLEAIPQGTAATTTKLPLNLCLVVDRSSSMRGDRLLQVKEAAQRIVEQLGSHDYFSLVTFNDRADIVIPAQRVNNRQDLKTRISSVEAAGGTEMATGLALALQEVQRAMLGRSISRILLLTDGRTYGDESRCVQIARRAQDRQIGLTALGIGNEWNEDLLETMAARENSRTQYITSAQEIAQVFNDEVQRMHSIFAQGVQLNVRLRKGGMLRSLDRVQPYIAPVPIIEEQDEHWSGKLGDWPSSDAQLFLLEMAVPPLEVGDQPLAQILLRYNAPNAGANERPQPSKSTVTLSVRPADEVEGGAIDNTVKRWLERLVAYRLQARAWQEAEAGDIEGASKRLQMAGTRLFESGEADLARTVQNEATRMLRSGHTSAEGRKRIKYGTRGLMGDDKVPQ
jgi:Mg-chelatase subunit ChlD